MSRTWREIPDSGFRDRISLKDQNDNIRLLRPVEEKKGINNHTKVVRDKDNHGCTYSKPSDFKKCHNRRYRSNVNQRLNKLANECYDIPRHTGKNITLPRPKEYQPYYW